MGHSGVASSWTRETPGETCVNERLPQGPSHNEDRLSSLPQTDLTDSKGRELEPLGAHLADDVTRAVPYPPISDSLTSLDRDGNSQGSLGDNSEEGKSLLTFSAMGKLPELTITDPQGKLNSGAQRENTMVPKLDLTQIKISLEGRLIANSQETSKLHEELKAAFHLWDLESKEQEQLHFAKDEEVSTLQRENHKFRGVINELNSRLAQVVELQGTVFQLKKIIGTLREEVNSLPSFRDKILEIEIGRAFRMLHWDNNRLREDLRKFGIQLQSATEEMTLKTYESQQLKESILLQEDVSSKLQKRVDEIQQQLCKDRIGLHGSYVDGSQTPFLLESAAKDMFSSITTFSNVLSKWKDTTGRNIVYSFFDTSAQWNNIRVARKHHWTYMLKNCISWRLFKHFEYDSFASSNGTVLCLDQEERANKCFNYYQRSKNKGPSEKSAYHASDQKLDSAFFYYFQLSITNGLLPEDVASICKLVRDYDDLVGASDNKKILQEPANKRELLFCSITAARKVWDFHKLCLSFNPPATIFRVWTGEPFNADYMESVDVAEGDDPNTVPTVSFMVYPGFRLRKSIIKCLVYLTLKT